ncbi:DUF3857 domain-containing protein [Flavisericum labens]|uniref:DUF3857 domain-containing protein n=1 Tax=Flavisericum labens TaxID=3377112 RepID=UPI00387A8BE9
MRLLYLPKVLFFFIALQGFTQENLYTSLTIPTPLSQEANAVIRLDDLFINLESSNEMLIRRKRIITVLNKAGNKSVDAYVYYDDNVKIKGLEVKVYNKFGANIKKIRKKDFKDVSAVDGGTLYTDSRVKFLEYTPTDYPYTIEFICETQTNNTAFIPPFTPVSDYFVSVENSSYDIIFPENINVRKKEKNLEGYDVNKEEMSRELIYQIKNLNSFKPEEYSPSVNDIAPRVLFAAEQFTLEGVAAEVKDWNTFGKWMYHDIIKETHDLPESTIKKVKDLVKNETNDLDKAKRIYQYVQDKVRYISVQVGIGGWKPFKASEVDALGYGDCKGLTNYTMSLLKAVGVESNYSVIYAGKSQRSVENDFAAMQGNHVILSIPFNGKTVWLECTSQKLPFGFIGDFTDDRDALIITPEGGKIEHTKKYKTEENLQDIKGSYKINNDGGLEAEVQLISRGIQYDDKYWLETETERDLDMHYKKRWKYINSIVINDMTIDNDKSTISFKETVTFKAPNYTKKAGSRMLLTVNAFNRSTHIPDRYRNRKYPLKIRRGFIDNDEVEITLPSGYSVEGLPKNIEIENKFGSYKVSFTKKDETKLVYNRTFIVNDGEYPKEDYKAFREFYKEVAKMDNAKAALIKNEL